MQVVFEQEFYNNLLYSAPTTWFHAFEAEECVAGKINFLFNKIIRDTDQLFNMSFMTFVKNKI